MGFIFLTKNNLSEKINLFSNICALHLLIYLVTWVVILRTLGRSMMRIAVVARAPQNPDYRLSSVENTQAIPCTLDIYVPIVLKPVIGAYRGVPTKNKEHNIKMHAA